MKNDFQWNYRLKLTWIFLPNSMPLGPRNLKYIQRNRYHKSVTYLKLEQDCQTNSFRYVLKKDVYNTVICSKSYSIACLALFLFPLLSIALSQNKLFNFKTPRFQVQKIQNFGFIIIIRIQRIHHHR